MRQCSLIKVCICWFVTFWKKVYKRRQSSTTWNKRHQPVQSLMPSCSPLNDMSASRQAFCCKHWACDFALHQTTKDTFCSSAYCRVPCMWGTASPTACIQQRSLPSCWGPSFDITSAVDRAGLSYSKLVSAVKPPWPGLCWLMVCDFAHHNTSVSYS